MLEAVVEAVAELLADAPGEVVACGLDHQGESVLAWDAETGEPLSPIVVWQDKRSQEVLDRLADREDEVQAAQRPALRPLLLRRQARLAAGARRGGAKAPATRAPCGWGRSTPSSATGSAPASPPTPRPRSRTQLQRIDTPASTPAVRDLRRPAGGPARGPGHRRRAGHAAATRAGRSSCLCAARSSTSRPRSPAPRASCPGRVKATYGTGVFVLAHVGEGVPEPRRRPAADGRLEHRRQGRVRARRRRLRGRRDARVALQGARPGRGPARARRARPRGRGLGRRAGAARPGRASARRGGGPNARAVLAGIHGGTTRANVARAALEGIAWRVADIVAAIRETRRRSTACASTAGSPTSR